MSAVTEAVVLMAGSGSRLRGSDERFLKPLVPIAGRPLVCHIIDALIHAGITKVNFIVGYQSERLRPAIEELVPARLEVSFIENPQWQKQNGISLLAAEKYLTGPFVLTMSDHLFEDAMIDLLLKSADVDVLNLAIDRKIDSVFDLDDAMKVQTRDGKVFAIGKNLREYDAIDTGLFVCPPEILVYLERARQNDDCSLADGVRLMAEDGKVRAIDIGAAWWQDVDTPGMLREAESRMQSAKRKTA